MNLRSLILPSLASLATPIMAAPIDAGGKYDDHSPDASFLADQMTDFMNKNSLEVRVRGVEFDRKFRKAVEKEGSDLVKTKRDKEGADALGIQVNFQSGWYAEAVGFDASLYTVGDLHSPNKKTRDLLLETGDGNRTGYSKLGQAYVKAKLQMDQEDPLLTFKGGRERIYTGLIAGSSSRATPSSWEGLDLRGGGQGLTYGLAWVDKISLRNSSNFEDLKSFKKKGTDDTPADSKADAEKIKSVWGAELAYTFMGLTLSYKDSHAKDFLYTYNLDASYKLNLSPRFDLTFNGKYYKEKEDGKLWIGTLWGGDPGFDKTANIKHFNITADIGDLILMAGYSKTSAKYTKDIIPGLGVYHYDFGWNTHGGFDVPTSMLIGDFLYDQEKAWVAGVGYDFREFVPGLKAEAFYTKGDGFKDTSSRKLKEWEADFDLVYNFQGPTFDGLSFRFRYGMYRPDGKFVNGTDFERGKDEARLYLDYGVKVF